MHRGYIKLWRKIQDWTWYSDVSLVGVFIHLLIKANHKDSSYMGLEVPRGSCVCGIHALAKETNLTPQKLRTIFIKLKSTNEITIKSTNRFSIVYIVNFDQYQESSTNKITNKITNEQQTDNKRITTSKECKEDKNEKNKDLFDRFYSEYPKKQGKQPALKAFCSLSLEGGLFEIMLRSLEEQKKSDQWTKENGQYIPLPATWLNQRRWEDQLVISTVKRIGQPICDGVPSA